MEEEQEKKGKEKIKKGSGGGIRGGGRGTCRGPNYGIICSIIHLSQIDGHQFPP
jgi:hypothetical protein